MATSQGANGQHDATTATLPTFLDSDSPLSSAESIASEPDVEVPESQLDSTQEPSKPQDGDGSTEVQAKTIDLKREDFGTASAVRSRRATRRNVNYRVDFAESEDESSVVGSFDEDAEQTTASATCQKSSTVSPSPATRNPPAKPPTTPKKCKARVASSKSSRRKASEAKQTSKKSDLSPQTTKHETSLATPPPTSRKSTQKTHAIPDDTAMPPTPPTDSESPVLRRSARSAGKRNQKVLPQPESSPARKRGRLESERETESPKPEFLLTLRIPNLATHKYAQTTLAFIPASNQGQGSSDSVREGATGQQGQSIAKPSTQLHPVEGGHERRSQLPTPPLPSPPHLETQISRDEPSAISTKHAEGHHVFGDPSKRTQAIDKPFSRPSNIGSFSDEDDTTEDEMVIDEPEGDEIGDSMEIDEPGLTKDEANMQYQKLFDLAKQLCAKTPLDSKPAPAGQPAVWAQGRQELCETLHYYRAYQSACYATGGFARAFMFDGNGHVRDHIDEEVVISRAGGGMVKDKDSGEMTRTSDQSADSPAVQGLKKCMKHYNPVVIMVGSSNEQVPSKPPHQYCVMDYFKPTHIWHEKCGKVRILRYRFEKLNTNKESWWRAENSQKSAELGSLDPPVEKTCDFCGKSSPQAYLNGWMCLEGPCSAFWKILDDPKAGKNSSTHEPEEASLLYDPRFLKQKTPWPNDNTDYPLSTTGAEVSPYSIAGEDTSQAFWSGIVCPKCGLCNSRLNWMGWECANPSCDYIRIPPHSLIPAASLREPFWPLSDKYTLSRDAHTLDIKVKVTFAHGYRINRYAIPGLDGFITHMIANKTVLEEEDGPDAMFEELQQTDIGLRRRAMPNGQLKGETHCRHFAVNYGMPYKFIAATSSQSFEGAARPITATRSRLNWAAKHLMAQESGRPMDEVAKKWKEKEFNEVLALGYFEAQKINFHDDGEYGLGPTIATLSLGAPGAMRIRMKSRHYNGCSSTAAMYDDSRPLLGCLRYEERLQLHTKLQALKASDPKAYRARLKAVPKEMKLKPSGNAKEALRMELGHGDIVVMHGAELQKYYEHAVEHAGKLRFALTCRYIDPLSLREEDRPAYVVGPDEGGYDGSKLG